MPDAKEGKRKECRHSQRADGRTATAAAKGRETDRQRTFFPAGIGSARNDSSGGGGERESRASGEGTSSEGKRQCLVSIGTIRPAAAAM